MLTEKNDKIRSSVIMTALNEEKNVLDAINNTLKAFSDFNIEGELIVINDGSTDGTGKIIRSVMARDTRLRIIDHDSPRGVGYSFWDGVSAAKGEVVNWFPGDNENDPCEIFRYLKLLDEVDMVIPFVRNKNIRPPFRNFLSGLYMFIINATFSTSLNYTNGTALYRRCVLNSLKHKSDGFFFQTDIIMRLVKQGYLFAEVPYNLGSREGGRSKAISFSSLWKVSKAYLNLVKGIYLEKERLNRYNFVEGSVSERRHKK